MSDIRILIVEDDLMSMSRLRKLLEDFKYSNIRCAANSSEAIDILFGDEIDLILMDIELENSKLNGIQLTEKVNAKYDIPIIYVTGNTEVETMQQVTNTQYAQFITKPYTPQQLHASITLAFLKHENTIEIDGNNTFSRKKDVFVKKGKKWIKILIADIVYLESIDGILHIHTSERKYSCTSTLKYFGGKKYSKDLIRIHNKYIIDISRMVSLDVTHHEVTIDKSNAEVVLPVGSTYRRLFYDRFDRL